LRRYSAGDVIFAEGEFGEKIYIIESGHVSILIGGNEVKRIVAKVGRSRLTLSNPS
jgi:CRP-like cAMP-binding protein